MAGINLREVSLKANHWDHPVKGLLKYAEAMRKHGGDIFRLPKKDRERYCLSIFTLALQHDSNLEWWTHMPKQDPPDGLIMTLGEVAEGGYKGLIREVEIVEHREEPNKLLDVIVEKMTGNSYEANTILGCLILTTSLYDLRKLSDQLSRVPSSISHVFVVFSGTMVEDEIPDAETLAFSYSMVQLLPTFQKTTFDFRPFLEDFNKRYEMGRESRLINGNTIHYGTVNPKYQKASI